MVRILEPTYSGGCWFYSWLWIMVFFQSFYSW